MLSACDIPVRSPRVGLPAQYGPRYRLARRVGACSVCKLLDTGSAPARDTGTRIQAPGPPSSFPQHKRHQHTSTPFSTLLPMCNTSALSLSSSHRRFSPYSPIIAPAPFSVSGLSLFVRCAKTVVCLGGWVGGQGGQASAPGTHV